jgi:hypothetical protein
MTSPTPRSEQPAAARQRQVTRPGSAKQKQKGGVRGGLLLLGLLLVVVSGGGFWYVLRSLDERADYLVAARTIERGEMASAADFIVVEANVGDAFALGSGQFGAIAGKLATGRIPAGTLVTPGLFEFPPLSSEEEAAKVLIEVSLPAAEAPGGELKTGDKVALFGAESTGLEGIEGFEPEVGLIGVLVLEFVKEDDDKVTYVVTPAEAKAIYDIVDRYARSSDRRIWKLGTDVGRDDLIDLYPTSEFDAIIDAAVDDAVDELFDEVFGDDGGGGS